VGNHVTVSQPTHNLVILNVALLTVNGVNGASLGYVQKHVELEKNQNQEQLKLQHHVEEKTVKVNIQKLHRVMMGVVRLIVNGQAGQVMEAARKHVDQDKKVEAEV